MQNDLIVIRGAGGGCGEAEVKREALSLLNANVSKKYYLDMSNDVASGEGMVCGGMGIMSPVGY